MAHTTHSSISRENGSSLQDIKEKGNEQINRVADKAQEQFNQVADSVQDMAGRLAEQGRDASQRAQEVAGNMQTAIHQSLRKQPMTTLALGVAAGFVLGALWKS